MGHTPEGYGFDPSEDPYDTPRGAHPSTRSDWIDCMDLSQILAFDLMLEADEDVHCARCGSAVFIYGRIRFCSSHCPENLLFSEDTAPR